MIGLARRHIAHLEYQKSNFAFSTVQRWLKTKSKNLIYLESQDCSDQLEGNRKISGSEFSRFQNCCSKL